MLYIILRYSKDSSITSRMAGDALPRRSGLKSRIMTMNRFAKKKHVKLLNKSNNMFEILHDIECLALRYAWPHAPYPHVSSSHSLKAGDILLCHTSLLFQQPAVS